MPIMGLGMPQSAISRFCVRQNRLIFAVPYKDCPACYDYARFEITAAGRAGRMKPRRSLTSPDLTRKCSLLVNAFKLVLRGASLRGCLLVLHIKSIQLHLGF